MELAFTAAGCVCPIPCGPGASKRASGKAQFRQKCADAVKAHKHHKGKKNAEQCLKVMGYHEFVGSSVKSAATFTSLLQLETVLKEEEREEDPASRTRIERPSAKAETSWIEDVGSAICGFFIGEEECVTSWKAMNLGIKYTVEEWCERSNRAKDGRARVIKGAAEAQQRGAKRSDQGPEYKGFKDWEKAKRDEKERNKQEVERSRQANNPTLIESVSNMFAKTSSDSFDSFTGLKKEDEISNHFNSAVPTRGRASVTHSKTSANLKTGNYHAYVYNEGGKYRCVLAGSGKLLEGSGREAYVCSQTSSRQGNSCEVCDGNGSGFKVHNLAGFSDDITDAHGNALGSVAGGR